MTIGYIDPSYNKIITTVAKVVDENYNINSNEIICFDTSNMRLGIGTQDPDHSLHISGGNIKIQDLSNELILSTQLITTTSILSGGFYVAPIRTLNDDHYRNILSYTLSNEIVQSDIINISLVVCKNIVTEYIDVTDHIDVNTISANTIDVSLIDVSFIDFNTISGDHIDVYSISANTIDVSLIDANFIDFYTISGVNIDCSNINVNFISVDTISANYVTGISGYTYNAGSNIRIVEPDGARKITLKSNITEISSITFNSDLSPIAINTAGKAIHAGTICGDYLDISNGSAHINSNGEIFYTTLTGGAISYTTLTGGAIASFGSITCQLLHQAIPTVTLSGGGVLIIPPANITCGTMPTYDPNIPASDNPKGVVINSSNGHITCNYINVIGGDGINTDGGITCQSLEVSGSSVIFTDLPDYPTQGEPTNLIAILGGICYKYSYPGNPPSDRNLKTNITPFVRKLDIVKQLNPVNFQWIETSNNDYGFIAQELEVLIPGVITNRNNHDGEITKVYTHEAALHFIPILTKAIQDLDEDKNKEILDLSNEVIELKAKLTSLESQLADVLSRLSTLEN